MRLLGAQEASEEPAEVRAQPDEWQLCAEVGNDTWMAWGTVEVPVTLARLRSVQSELRWSLGIAGAAAAFWLLALPAALTVRFATIPSGSMEPTVHQGPRAAGLRGVDVGSFEGFEPFACSLRFQQQD